MKGPDDPEPDHPAPLAPYDFRRIANAEALRQRALDETAFWRDQAITLYAELHGLQLPLRRERIERELLARREKAT